MGASSEELVRLDGNAAAGMLRDVFAVEMTTAACTCGECGRASAVGGLLLYGGAMGTVLRCPSCEALVLCITSVPSGHFVELRAIVRLHAGDGDSQVALHPGDG
jgi:hypothetical protein